MTDTPTTETVAPEVEAPKKAVKAMKPLNMKPNMYPAMEMAMPEAVRAMAERSVAQTRDGYEKAKTALEDAVGVLEKSIDMAGKGTAELNRKVIDIAQENLNSGFDLARGLAGARNLAEILEIQGSYFRKQLEVLAAQAADVRELSSRVATDTAEPLKSHVSSTIDKLKLN
ncbi:MAG: phasin family protein [Hyphomicrobiales bacterium]